MAGRAWTVAERRLLVALHGEGLSRVDLALRLGRSEVAVKRALRGVGRSSGQGELWLEADRERLVRLRLAGVPLARIGVVLGRSTDSVKGALRRVVHPCPACGRARPLTEVSCRRAAGVQACRGCRAAGSPAFVTCQRCGRLLERRMLPVRLVGGLVCGECRKVLGSPTQVRFAGSLRRLPDGSRPPVSTAREQVLADLSDSIMSASYRFPSDAEWMEVFRNEHSLAMLLRDMIKCARAADPSQPPRRGRATSVVTLDEARRYLPAQVVSWLLSG